MKKSEVKGLGKAELKEKLSQLRKELMKLNAQIATGTTPKSPGHLKVIKKTIARINTKLNREEAKKV